MAVSVNRSQLYKEIEQMLGRVPEWVTKMPDEFVPHFWAMFRDLDIGETKIPNKYKELMGLAVAGATRCKYCAFFHTQAARLFGATDDEIAEAAAMGGLTMAASTFINAEQLDYETFKRETLEMVKYVREQQAKQKRPQVQAQPH